FLNAETNWSGLVFVLSFTALLSLLPVSIGSLGIREGAMVFALILFGVNQNTAIAAAFINRLFLYLFALTGGWLYLLHNSKLLFNKTKKKD
ncbi:MAG TPA: lysylphosphatidylglycerol synthase domain-containing protein, partial [Spirochaetota bacterium]|nr:lysylphosphatidylglycerol synthase domain-containing protein [Spirochaetota bacterium]